MEANQIKNFNVVMLAASAMLLTAFAVAASVGFVQAVSINEAPPEHEIKSDLFEAHETSANQAAAHFLPSSKISD